MRLFNSKHDHVWKITKEEGETMYRYTVSTYEGYQSFEATCESQTHECCIGTCYLQIWYQYEFTFQTVTLKPSRWPAQPLNLFIWSIVPIEQIYKYLWTQMDR